MTPLLRQRSLVGIGGSTAILPTSTTAAVAASRAIFLPARLPKRSPAQAGANGLLLATVETATSSGAGGPGTVAYDASSTSISTGYAATPQTKTWTHTTAGSNRVLVLTADIFQDVAGTGSITSATYNGTALTKVTNVAQGTKSCEVWYLKNPPSGANTLSVTVTGDTDAIKLGATSFTNVDQTAPLDTSNTAVGSTGNPAVSLTTTTANDVIVSTIDRHTTADATTSQTKIFKDNVASILGAASYQLTTTAGSYTDTYTGAASANWCMIAAGFKPVTTSAGSGSTTIRYLSTDILNGSNIVTDSSGSAVESIDAYPYGAPRVDAKVGSYGGEKRKYAGTEYDSTSGLNYMNARYQNGAQGQFISEDPILLGVPAAEMLASPATLNLYGYSSDNPITKSDPSGLLGWDTVKGIGVGWVGGAVQFASNPIGSTYAAGYNFAAAGSEIYRTNGGAITQGFNELRNSSDYDQGLIISPVAGIAAGAALSGLTAVTTPALANYPKGMAFQEAQFKLFQKDWPMSAQEVTIRTQSGVRTRVDMIGQNSSGTICITECKSSATAPLTQNQTKAFPELQQSGGVVAGQGKPGFPGGTVIAPTKVQIKRP